jgi:tRNA A37 threonylcarbamoyladenosine dehydratase
MTGSLTAANLSAARYARFQRLALITGAAALDALTALRVIVVGIGGVGSWCAEALARSGVGSITLIDCDTVCVTNINRQVQATAAAVGQLKTDALKRRLLEINPDCEVRARAEVFSAASAASAGFGFEDADYIIDAIDSLTYKLDLIEYAAALGKPLYSSMGMAQKLDPTRLKTASVWESSGCPLARNVRQGLRKRGFSGDFTVVYSPEYVPRAPDAPFSGCGTAACLCPPKSGGSGASPEWCASKKVINGSAVTVTATAGMILASLVINDVYRKHNG